MNRKQAFVLSLVTLVTLALTAGAFYQYQDHAVKVDAKVQKIQAQRDSAVREVEGMKQAHDLNLESAQNEIKTLTAENIQICAALRQAKILSPYCR